MARTEYERAREHLNVPQVRVGVPGSEWTPPLEGCFQAGQLAHLGDVGEGALACLEVRA